MNVNPSFRNALYLITDRHQVPEGKTLLEVIEQALIGGVRLIQLREKDLTAAELWPLAQNLRALTNRFSAKLFVNDRIDVALACDADGIHLGGHSLPIATTRKLIGRDRLIGVSTHSLSEALIATEQGADFITFGPILNTPSKSEYGPPLGYGMIEQACQETPLPVLALGGIKNEHIEPIMSRGASGISLISGIISSIDPQSAARQLTQLVQQSSTQ